MSEFNYSGSGARKASFPLGGIGTGSIGLSAHGRLIDWQIFNRPNKGGFNGYSHFAIRAERDEEIVGVRILNGPFDGEYEGTGPRTGVGARRESMAGLPHFEAAAMDGRFPVAAITYTDDAFPARVRQTAFNPFIPNDEDSSSIPAAMFEFDIENVAAEALDYTLYCTVRNPCPGSGQHRADPHGDGCILQLASRGLAMDDLQYGDLSIATDAADHAAQRYWFRGQWFDSMQVYWRDLNAPGPLRDRDYPGVRIDRQMHAETDHATLSARVRVSAGGTARLRFAISWNFPNCEAYWLKDDPLRAGHRWRNWYATRWTGSSASAAYVLDNWERLSHATHAFRDALFDTTLPDPVIEAVSANLSTLKSPVALRLEDGSFWGWEGVWGDHGAWQGTCSHVWNYAQAMPFLFPRLERGLRETELTNNLRPDGGLSFRTMLPLGSGYFEVRPCADGQFGTILKTYREWRASGDSTWLRRLWPSLERAMAFTWSPDNPDLWDPDQTGILRGRQHHTLDMELFGPNAWLTSFYLGALRAMAEMAQALGEPGEADYSAIFERGRAAADTLLFNGEYYVQRLDLDDEHVLTPFDNDRGGFAGVVEAGFVSTYWSDEHGEVKYQLGDGCFIDQVLGQWHADLYGLGDLFERPNVRSALAAIYRHNHLPSMAGFENPSRLYAIDDEGGTIICVWPEGTRKPTIPAPYAEETFHGMEYAVASHMILNGLVAEGEAVVAAVRARYDGSRRNPWGEMEHGFHYARSMASYALLLSYSRLRFDMTRGLLGFSPTGDGPFRCLFALGGAWGVLERADDIWTIRLKAGDLALGRLWFGGHTGGALQLNGAPVPHGVESDVLLPVTTLALGAGDVLQFSQG